MKLPKNWYWYVIGIVLIIILTKQCEKEPETKTVTKVVYKDRVDTIQETIIKEVPKKVYYEVIKTVKGKDSIIYVDKPSDTSIKANVYDVTIKADSSSAELKITSLTKPIDVRGVIKCKEKETTIKETIVKAKSGLFIYADVPISGNVTNLEGGLIYQFKNTMLIKGGVQYNSITKTPDIKVGVGIKIF